MAHAYFVVLLCKTTVRTLLLSLTFSSPLAFAFFVSIVAFLFFRDMLSAEVSSRSTICLEEAEILIEQGISLIIDKHQSNIENYANQKIGGFRRFARGVFEFMPSLGSLYRNLMPFTQPKRFDRSLDGWVQANHRHYDDFMPIHRAMTSPRVSLLL